MESMRQEPPRSAFIKKTERSDSTNIQFYGYTIYNFHHPSAFAFFLNNPFSGLNHIPLNIQE